jgi:DNA-binding CsgD family transcriptional regulator
VRWRPGGTPWPAVADRTRGNPFFVGELGRVLTTEPGGTRVPVAVRDVVRRRLARLPDPARTLLDVLAVLGREPDLARAAAVAGTGAGALLDGLAPAVDDGLLEQPPGRAGLRFAHDLVRETLLVELAPAERARIHHRVVDVLQPVVEPDVLPELAHHALAALPLGDPAQASRWAAGAAGLAMVQLAHEEAARLYGRAVEVGRGALTEPERVELLLATARAQALAHDVPGAAATCAEVAELARRTGDAEALGRAALGMPEVSEVPWLTTVRGWAEEALRGLGDGDSPLRARLLAQLAHSLVLAADRPGTLVASEQSLAMAERLDDPASLVSALRARQMACSDADGNAERLVLGGRMLAVSARSGQAADAMWGHLWRFDALLQAGRVADAEAELDALEPIVAGLHQPMARLHLLRSRIALAFGRGRFAEATLLNEEAVALADGGGHLGAAATGRSMRFTIGALTGGDPGDVSWFVGNPNLAAPFTGLSRAAYAQVLMSAGRADEARAWYDGLPEPGSPRIPAFMAMTTEVMRVPLAADLGDAATAETCHRLLLPYADLHAVGGAGAITTSGSVRLYLGIAALGAGRPDAAIRHLRTAITVNDASGLAPFAALARHRLAVALRARGRAADADEAVALAVTAGDAADRLGMKPLRAEVDALIAQRDGVLSRREVEIAELVGRGLTNRQIAAAAHISERTAESHVQHVLAKLGFSSRSQIAAWVVRRGG